MKSSDLDSMSADELWRLHEKLAAKLTDVILAKRARLDERLRQIQPIDDPAVTRRPD